LRKFAYEECLADDMKSARRRERDIFDRAIALMQKAELSRRQDHRSEAVFYIRQFWKIIIDDLSDDENGLPEQLRASLISIGIWVLRESIAVEQDIAASFHPLIETMEIVRAGLA
jgi:flagellar protein FlaF